MFLERVKPYLDKVDAVSFDVFDTLILRLYSKPTDLFSHLEESGSRPGFAAARIEAEQAARREALEKGQSEVTLEEIYARIHPAYRKLREMEAALEVLMCRANPDMQPVYREALRRGLPIYLCSDMYLPRETLETILSQAGYQNYTLLLSSETGRPKATGEMYQDLLVKTGLPGNRIMHIGDHPYTDGEMAEKAGLLALSYEPPRRRFGADLHSAFFAVLHRYMPSNVSLSVLEGMTVRRQAGDSGDFWADFGYRYAGLLTYGYAQWIRGRMEAEGQTQAVALLRDGYLVGQALKTICPPLPVRELYASRRMFLLSGAKSYEDLRPALIGPQLLGHSYAALWRDLCLDVPELEEEYRLSFPEQDALITRNEDLASLDAFWKAHEAVLLQEGAKERELLAEYWEQEQLFRGEATACIDLGWKGSILRGLQQTLRLLGKDADVSGYYLGTHACDTAGLHLMSYLLDHGKAAGAVNGDVLLDYGFTVQLLELVFSAPRYSVRKLIRRDGALEPLEQEPNPFEAQRIQVSRHITEGVMDFVREFDEINRAFPLPISKEAVLAPWEYLSRKLSKWEEREIEKIPFSDGFGGDDSYRPILRQGHPAIGIINPWPGDMSAEAEVLTRFRRAAEENHIECVYLDNFGHVLDPEDQTAGDAFVDAQGLSFAITTHYETPKVLNAFYYHTLWNPPEIPLDLPYYTERVTDNYVMNDDYLIYDAGGMSNHLKGMLMNCPRSVDGASSLTASFPRSAMLLPRLEDPTMFYCGMNWEKTVHGTNRHEGLFKLLDSTGKVKFFGPEKVDAWGGLRPWEGYKCYQYSIPFDGFSILREINTCGICLVLSSDIHRRAGAATNRTYEACAAGAVIISDDNPFMLQHFRDAALFITYNKNNPRDTFRQIMEKYDWILSHREEALAMARRAQDIFREKFCLDVQLQRILQNHPARCEQIRKDLFARDTSAKVLVTLVLNTQDEKAAAEALEPVIANVHGQIYPCMELGIAADTALADRLTEQLAPLCVCAHVVSLPLFDKKGARQMTDGQAIRALQKAIPHDYYINTTPNELWFYDHITTLVRAMEDHHTLCAYSGAAFEDREGYRRINFYARLDAEYLFSFTKPERPLWPGQFLFRAQARDSVPDYLTDDLDGMEHIAGAGLLHYRQGEALSFTHRMSLVQRDRFPDAGQTVLPREMQIRFIQDLLRYHLPEQMAAAAEAAQQDISRKTVLDMLLLFPLKNYIKLRYYRHRLRKLPGGTPKYARAEAKYQSLLEEFKHFYGEA